MLETLENMAICVFTYGPGVWGMLPALTSKIQTLLNCTLHHILCLSKHARNVCIALALRQFGLPRIDNHAFASSQSARIFLN